MAEYDPDNHEGFWRAINPIFIRYAMPCLWPVGGEALTPQANTRLSIEGSNWPRRVRGYLFLIGFELRTRFDMALKKASLCYYTMYR
jgi:hypothetical protein